MARLCPLGCRAGAYHPPLESGAASSYLLGMIDAFSFRAPRGAAASLRLGHPVIARPYQIAAWP